MKKIVLVLSFIASAFVLVGCNNTGCGACAQPDVVQPVAVHHDYKGEVTR